MSNYLNIISNWGTSAQQGRNEAKREMEMQIKTMQLEQERKMNEQQAQELTKQNINYINAQGEELTKNYRPQDLENMKAVAEDAQNEIKSQLEFYGDDVSAFMRGGGLQHLKNYRDAILNSDAAKTIRANHGNITKYLDLMDKTPHLVSKIDQQGFENWKSGKVNAFIFHGEYRELEKPNKEDISKYGGNLGEAYLDASSENYWDTLYNYNVDTNQNLGRDDVSRDELIDYLNGTYLGEYHVTADFREEVGKYKNNSKLASEQLNIINSNINSGYQGDFAKFWDDKSNWNSRVNLTNRTGAGSFSKQSAGDIGIYSSGVFMGKEDEILSNFFAMDKKDYNGTIDRSSINKLIQQGGFTLYDKSGHSLSPGETLIWRGYDKSLDVIGVRYGLEIATNRDNNEFKLLTWDDVEQEGDDSSLNKNKAKDGALFIALRDTDWYNKDELLYIKVDTENKWIAQQLDDAVGTMDYKAKTTAETSPGEYVFQPGKKFSFSGDNPRQAVLSLHNIVDKSMKGAGYTEEDPYTYATLITHALSLSEDYVEGESPEFFINEIAKSEDPVAKKAIANLKNGNIAGYVKTFQDAGQMTTKEGNKLLRDIQAILRGYQVLGEQYKQEQ